MKNFNFTTETERKCLQIGVIACRIMIWATLAIACTCMYMVFEPWAFVWDVIVGVIASTFFYSAVLILHNMEKVVKRIEEMEEKLK